MTVKDFLKGIHFKVVKSKTKMYEGTDTPICYLSLNAEVKGQDYLVLSKDTAAEMLEADDKIAYLAECETVYSEEADCWGVIRKRTTEVLAEWQF